MSSMVSSYVTAGIFSFANMGWPEWALIFAIILIFFGPKRLPQLAKSIGRAITDFKRGLHEVREDIEKDVDEEDRPAQAEGQDTTKKESVPPAQNTGANSH